MADEKNLPADSLPLSLPPVNIEPLDDWLHVRPSVEEIGRAHV